MALADNIVGYWKLDESSGSAADSVGSRTLSNTNVTYSTSHAKINNAAQFAGNGRLSGTSYHAGSSDFTISFWVYFPTTAGYQEQSLINVWEDSSSSNREWGLLIYGSASPYSLQFNTSGDGINGTAATGSITSATLHHVVAVKSGTNLTLYIDNSVAATASGAPSTIFNSTTPFQIGAQLTTRFTTGTIDEVGLWSRALSSTEVSDLYNSGSGKQYPFAAVFNQVIAVTSSGIGSVTKTIRRLVLLAVTAAGIANVTKTIVRLMTLAVSTVGVAKVTKGLTKTISTSSIGIAAVTKRMAKTIAVSASGLAVVIASKAYLVVLATTATGVAGMKRVAGKLLSVTGIGVVGLKRGISKTVAVSGVGLANLKRGFSKTIAATAIGVTVILAGRLKTIAVVASGAANITKGMAKTISTSAQAMAGLIGSRGVLIAAVATASVGLKRGIGKLMPVIAQALSYISIGGAWTRQSKPSGAWTRQSKP